MICKYKLVIFDLDGVLVDACEWHRIALNKSLKEVCDYEIPLSDHYSEFNGIPTREKLKKLVTMGVIDDVSIDKIYEIKQKNTILAIKNNATIRPEKIEMLTWLRSHNIHVACFTNSIRETAMLMLEKTGIIDLFELITTNQDVENPKPDPEGYISTLKYFNIDSDDTLIIEDSPKGVTAAERSGCNVIIVKNPDEVSISLFAKREL